MTSKIALRRSGLIRLASAGSALIGVLSWSATAEAQYGSKYGPYGSPYGSYSKKYKDYYDDDMPAAKNDPGDMEPFKRSGVPILAVVALDAQRIVIYDNAGKKFLESPVSTGNVGYETPAGIFSVVQKKPDHNSNLYEDGNMPFMQRITWTGIALHAGVLPGYPASHGCVRMPINFAQRLFDVTDVGMRVVVMPNEVVPAVVEPPKMFKAAASQVNVGGRPVAYGSPEHVRYLKSIASTKKSAAEGAQRTAKDARTAADKKAAEVTAATKALRAAEAALARAEGQIKDADKDLETANASTAPNAAEAVKRAETAKQNALTRLEEAKAQIDAAKAQVDAKTTAAAAAEEDAKKAEAAADIALEASSEAERATLPVSVFISRKTQRLYVRQGYKPVYEGPVAIQDSERPLGTYIFSAATYNDNRPHWIMVSMYGANTTAANVVRSSARKGEAKRTEAFPADVDGARNALDRITIPPQVMQQISSVVLPGSSLIISDEGPSIETGKDTDFVVIISGEPQGGLKVRRKDPPQSGWGNYGNKGWPPSGGFFFPKW